jgi:hypothetical protein
MSTCISMGRFILITGTLHGLFGGSRGLCQGNLLSPLLFVIVIQALGKMLSRAMVGCNLLGFQVATQNAAFFEISHIVFADDTLIKWVTSWEVLVLHPSLLIKKR